MKNNIKIVVNNLVEQKELLAEHGLALWIAYNGNNYLFDTGQGLALIHNLRTMNLNIEDLDGVIISHGHYDHLGGLEELVKYKKNLKVFGHHENFKAKFVKRKDGQFKSSSTDFNKESLLAMGVNFCDIKNLTKIKDNLYLTGEVPRRNNFEDTGGDFYDQKQGVFQKDLIIEDQSLIIDTVEGLIVVLGCSHAGIINILDYVQQQFEQRSIHTVIGGMHLVSASTKRLEQTLAELKKFNIKRLIPLHCTGYHATHVLKNHFPASFIHLPVGAEIEF